MKSHGADAQRCFRYRVEPELHPVTVPASVQTLDASRALTYVLVQDGLRPDQKHRQLFRDHLGRDDRRHLDDLGIHRLPLLALHLARRLDGLRPE